MSFLTHILWDVRLHVKCGNTKAKQKRIVEILPLYERLKSGVGY